MDILPPTKCRPHRPSGFRETAPNSRVNIFITDGRTDGRTYGRTYGRSPFHSPLPELSSAGTKSVRENVGVAYGSLIVPLNMFIIEFGRFQTDISWDMSKHYMYVKKKYFDFFEQKDRRLGL